MRSVLADTGPLVALFARRDRDHARVVRFLRDNPCLLVTTWPVATEAWHLLAPSARLGYARWLLGGGAAILELGEDDHSAMLALLERYRDRPMDIADASLVTVAERTGINEILTVDRADFDVYRLAKGRRFVQVP